MAGSKKTQFSLGGVALVVLAFVVNHFFGTGADATTDPKNDQAPPSVTAPGQEDPGKATPAPRQTQPSKSTPAVKQPAKKPAVAKPKASGPGFTSRRSWQSHFEKHGHEFRHQNKDEYLAMAQLLRDADVGPRVLEAVRKDGVTTRFDKDSGAFIAFNRDRTIRTLFKPNDGERYFRRQLNR